MTALPSLHLALVMGDAGGDVDATGHAAAIRVEGRRLFVVDDGIAAEADADTGCATGRIARHRLSDPLFLREVLLDPLLLFLLTHHGVTPLHAAGFVIGDLAVLLAGASGAGKSCLALAARDAGHPLLSDDTVYVRRMPVARIWGIPRPIHVFPEDAPPGDGAATIRIRGGKRKHALPVVHAASATTARRATLCILSRGDRLSLDPIDRAEADRRMAPQEEGFDLLRDDIAAVVDWLTPDGAWLLTLSDDPAEAVALLGARLPCLDRRAAR